MSSIDQLLTIMATLRHPQQGCAWDKAQTFQTIVPYTIEEAYEVADAIERGDLDDLKDELGDLLFQVVFYSQMAFEQGRFEFNDCVAAICDKLTRRHPHIFAAGTEVEGSEANGSETTATATNSAVADAQSALQNWEALKSTERKKSGLDSVLDNVPASLPALSRAYKLQKRCASVGFDWPSVDGCWDKVKEEILEVEQTAPGSDELADELGDLMFALVNVVRKHGLEPEGILRQANAKFERRFRSVEQQLAGSTTPVGSANLEQMEAAWQQAKAFEKSGRD
ncbi:nucleoside triphosphate pyrophosphohydrolase [Rheinheimera sp. SA_1]|uniref:nucleoside triphosphate pyrophosphohydrolase n=1 Tax=Rheinheimera sp. SA_1 TaxID=1827365 RepID=UPI0007FF1B89|nr:nucleoside triphosphate pyrophosphohydrolase [Rheinheimera sp. SA_1]OBP13880.1 nucleoside triphosphate pyrophosphohydrolase [Rheinheimera sp. SA_1]